MNPEKHSGSCRLFGGWQSFLCFAVVFAAWGAWEKWGAPRFWVVNMTVTSALNALVVKNLIWLLPVAVCLLCKVPTKWPLRSLFSRRIPWMLVFCSSCAMLAALHTIWLITNRGNTMIMPYSFLFVLLSVCAGFTEELLFRGFLLNSTLAVYPAPAAVVITGMYFVLIHFTPLLFGASPTVLLSVRSLQIFLMGSFFAVVLMRTRNLIVPMLLHTIWNSIVHFYGLY